MRIRQKRQRTDRWAVIVIALAAVSACVIGGGFLFARFSQVGTAAESDNPVQQLALAAYLALNADDLNKPAGEDATPINFTVVLGETAEAVAERLAEMQLVSEARLLTFYMRYNGLDQSIEAGDFILRRTMTIPQIAKTLTDASAREVVVRITEGWRREQIAASLVENPALTLTAEEWLTATGPNARPGAFNFYADLPSGVSLEGFLYPDTYLVRPGASAIDVLDKMLAAFDKQVTPELRAGLANRNISLYQAVILASLIEREAVLDDERPVIASVMYNRLTIGQPLQIDAALQYALATPENWWPPVIGIDLLSINSPYNTYRFTGLPPAPISNVRAASLQAVANPAQTTFYYYRATCDGSGRHNFSQTYDEHVAKACP
ncbi:MAG: endolytic transglycosylase MltG [Anaerolineales bacterium]